MPLAKKGRLSSINPNQEETMNAYQISAVLLINCWFIFTSYHFHSIKRITMNEVANNIALMTLMSFLLIKENTSLYFAILSTKIIFNLFSALLTYEVGGFIRKSFKMNMTNNVVYVLSLITCLLGSHSV